MKRVAHFTTVSIAAIAMAVLDVHLVFYLIAIFIISGISLSYWCPERVHGELDKKDNNPGGS